MKSKMTTEMPLKSFLRSNFRILISRVLICCLLICPILSGLTYQKVKSAISHGGRDVFGFTQPRLLLNSGLSHSSTAKAEIILWFPEKIPGSLTNSLPQGWEWRKKAVAAGKNGAVTLSGVKIVGKEEENTLLPVYRNLANLASEYKGQAYLDERLQESIDIYRYFAGLRADPEEWAMSGLTHSLAGYKPGLSDPVIAGGHKLNIQILTRSSGGMGASVLAVPVLLNEF